MILDSEVKESIRDCVLCWLATASKDNFPNVSPKEVFTHHGESKLLIANIASPGSVINIMENPKVCVSFVDVFVQRGFQLKGEARIISREDEEYELYYPVLHLIATDKFPISSIISIEITHVKPILAPSYVLYPNTSRREHIAYALETYRVNELLKHG